MPAGESPEPKPDRIDKLIERINDEHAWEVRKVRGKDINDHFQQLIVWEADKNWAEMLALYEEIIPATHRLMQYDDREPQAYWPMKAATIYLRIQEPYKAVKVLSDWLEAWPDERGEKSDRRHVRERLTRILNKHF